MSEGSSTKVKVWPVLRDCRVCPLVRKDTGMPRGDFMCSLCASLVRAEDGTRYVYTKGIEDGADGFTVDASELTPAPRVLR